MISKKQREKLAEEFIEKNGAVKFNFKERTLEFPDGGLFSIEKKILYRSRARFVDINEGKYKGWGELKRIKGKKVRYEDYEASVWFEELRELINYLKRLEKILNKMGYKTDYRLEDTKFAKKMVKKMNLKGGN